jgi:beta-glucosidase/6-phospho-beta-glucosidase/beta-galactosidase
VAAALGTSVRYYVTFNEPLVYTMAGWVDGQFPPGKRDFPLSLEVCIVCMYPGTDKKTKENTDIFG